MFRTLRLNQVANRVNPPKRSKAISVGARPMEGYPAGIINRAIAMELLVECVYGNPINSTTNI
jgi:hypothetical protein